MNNNINNKKKERFKSKKTYKYVFPKGLKHYFKAVAHATVNKMEDIFMVVSVGCFITYTIYVLINSLYIDKLVFKIII